jgi:hypothetical protein
VDFVSVEASCASLTAGLQPLGERKARELPVISFPPLPDQQSHSARSPPANPQGDIDEEDDR